MTPEALTLPFYATRGASRHDGPATSRAAGRSLDGQHLRDQQALVLTALCDMHRRLCNGGNAWEIQSRLLERGKGVQQSVVSKRLGELRAKGLVEIVGERPGSSHRMQQVYVPTPAGLGWVAARAEQ